MVSMLRMLATFGVDDATAVVKKTASDTAATLIRRGGVVFNIVADTSTVNCAANGAFRSSYVIVCRQTIPMYLCISI